MQVIDVEHRDIHVKADFSLEQLKCLKEFIRHSTVEYNSEEEPHMVETDEYISKKLYPFLDAIIRNIEENNEQG